MNRRTFSKTLSGAAALAANAVRRASASDENAPPFQLWRNSRKTGPVSSAPPEDQASSYAVWRRAAAPFALSVMLWTVFRDLPFEQRLERCAEAGYKNIELVGELPEMV